MKLTTDDVIVAVATDAQGRSSEFNFYEIQSLSILSALPNPTPLGQPYTVTVRAVAAPSAPFAPNGDVKVSDGRGGECRATLAPTATAGQAEGSCELLSTGAPGNITLTASLSSLESAFALASGASIANVTASHSLRDTLVVDTTADSATLSACTTAPGDCSLRGAVTRANSAAGADIIAFNIPTTDPGCDQGTGVCRITVTSDFPFISQPLTINGYTQPGAQPNTIPAPGANNAELKIEITGAPGFLSNRFLNVAAVEFELSGVAMFMPSFGMIAGGPNSVHRIHGNWFGVTATASVPDYSGGGSVFDLTLGHRQVLIGGPTPAQRNVIAGSGRDFSATPLPGGGSNSINANSIAGTRGVLLLQGNLIGLAPDGVTPLPFRDPFIVSTGFDSFDTPDVQILDNRFARPPRVFGGNFGGALQMSIRRVMTEFALIQGNVFGLGVNGSVIGVEKDHIVVFLGNDAQVPRLLIGGLGAGQGNTFAGGIRTSISDLGSAVRLPSNEVSTFVEFVGNRMLGNAGIGLDFPTPSAGGGVALGRTPNDPGDADSRANQQQNHPTISAFSLKGNEFDVTYQVDSAPANSSYPLRVDFYRALGDEGEVLLASDVYAEVDAQQDKSVTLSVPPGETLTADDVVVAIATDAQGRSSEFNFYLIQSLSIVSDEPDPTPVGLPYTVVVRAEAAPGEPFAPNGDVRIVDGRGGECRATLAPTATAGRAEGSCQLFAVGAPGTLTLTASLSSLESAFALATGASVANATTSHTIAAGISSLELVSGSNQSTPIGKAFTEPLVVRALTAGGTPLAGVPVQFTSPATGAGASFAPVTPVTGADGLASTTATAIGAGGSHQVTARVGALSQVFALTNQPGFEATLSIVANTPNPSNPGQSVTVAINLPAAPNAPAPTGSVVISANSGESCTILLPASNCAISFATLGERVIQAFYAGDTSYISSKAAFANQLVQTPPSLRIDDVSQNEGDSGSSTMRFTVTLDNPLGGDVSVDFATADGTATAPSDYVAASGTLNFSGATSAQTIEITINGDTGIEADEPFFVNLSDATGATIADGQGIGTILNDDQAPPPAASINDVTVQEPVSSGLTEVLARFTVSLDRPATESASLRVRTQDGSAVAPEDYDANDFVLEFAPGDQSLPVEIFVSEDEVAEGIETFTVVLSQPQGLSIADGVGVGTIFDGGTNATITVTSSADPGDGLCTPSECTLREAISLGNTLELIRIGFNIPGDGPHSIRPLTPLPALGPSIHTIDGYTQPGSQPNTVRAANASLDSVIAIELDGSALGTGSVGLNLVHGATIRGLAIHSWRRAGLQLRTRADGRPMIVAGNYIGTDASGQLARGNGIGIEVLPDAAVLGAYISWSIGNFALSPQDRNLISGNLADAIRIVGGSNARGQLIGNLIGLARDGSELGNQGHGITLLATSAQTLGAVASSNNHLCSNAAGGIRIASLQIGPASAARFRSTNDWIGTNNGTACHNGGHAIDIGDDSDSVKGVVIDTRELDHGADSAVRIRGPQTEVGFNASSLPLVTTPIDLGSVGPTPNDPGDGDSGANRLLNTPVLLSAEVNDLGNRVQVRYQIDTPLDQSRLTARFFAQVDGRLQGIGRHTYLGGVATAEFSTSRLGIDTPIVALTQFADAGITSELSTTPVPIAGRQVLASVPPVREGIGAVARFTITLDEPVTAPTLLNYRTIDGTAIAGSDYQATSGSLSLTPATPSATLDVPLINDSLIEQDESFLLEVFSPNNFAIGSALVKATILDDDRLRQDRSQFDPLDLDALNGIEGFRIEHPRADEANLVDLGNFDGSAGTDLMLALANTAEQSNNRSSIHLLPNLAPPFRAVYDLPALGSLEFPRIADTTKRGAGYLAGAAGLLRGNGELPSMVLRNITQSIVVHGRTVPLAASTDLESLIEPGSAEVILGPSFRTTPVGDVNGDGLIDFAVDFSPVGSTSAAVIFGSSGPLPTSLAMLNGSNGFTLSGQGGRMSEIRVRGVGDIDGDGHSELTVISRVSEGFLTAWLIRGRSTFPPEVQIEEQIFWGNIPIGTPPRGVVTPFETAFGDLNGDGHLDVVIHAPAPFTTLERNFVFLLMGNGTVDHITNGQVNRIDILEAFPGDGLGTGLAVLDLDGNGIDDLAIGAAGADQPGTGSGRVAILFGQPTWPPFIGLDNPPPQRVKFLTAKSGAGAGLRLAAISDLNGDGRDELAITAPASGRSYVYFSFDGVFYAGSEAAPPPAPARQVFSLLNSSAGQISISSLNELLPVGDLDGDGRPDVMLGVPEQLASCPQAPDDSNLCELQTGAELLIPGAVLNGRSAINPRSPPSGTTRFRRAEQLNQPLSGQYAGIGDFNGDGRDDLAFVSVNRDRVSVLFGRAQGLPAFVDPINMRNIRLLFALDGNDALRVARLGDIDGDGLADIGILRGTAGARYIEIIYGAATGSPRRSRITAPTELQPISLARTPRLGRIRPGAIPADSFEVALGDGSRAVVFGAAVLPDVLDLGTLSGQGMYVKASQGLPINTATLAALGDIDGDGIDDFGIAHSPLATDGSAQGRIEILRGRPSWPTSLDVDSADPALIAGRVVLRGEGVGSITGLDALRDRNGDGRRELLISLGGAEGHAPQSGKAFIVYGPALPGGQQTLIEFDDEVPVGQGITLRYGKPAGSWAILRNLGDLDGDGFDDIAFGADANDGVDGLIRSGSVGVLRGSALPQ